MKIQCNNKSALTFWEGQNQQRIYLHEIIYNVVFIYICCFTNFSFAVVRDDADAVQFPSR